MISSRAIWDRRTWGAQELQEKAGWPNKFSVCTQGASWHSAAERGECSVACRLVIYPAVEGGFFGLRFGFGVFGTGVPLVSSCTAPSLLFAKLTGLWLFLSAGGVCQHYVDGSCPLKCASVGLSSLAPLTSLVSCGRASKDTGRREQAIVSWRCIIGCEVLGKFEQSFRTIWASFLACFLNQPLTQLRESSTFSIVHNPCVP